MLPVWCLVEFVAWQQMYVQYCMHVIEEQRCGACGVTRGWIRRCFDIFFGSAEVVVLSCVPRSRVAFSRALQMCSKRVRAWTWQQ